MSALSPSLFARNFRRCLLAAAIVAVPVAFGSACLLFLARPSQSMAGTLITCGILSGILLAGFGGAAFLSARALSRSARHDLALLAARAETLKNVDNALPHSLPPDVSQEVARVMEGLSDLSRHLTATTVPLKTLDNVRIWHRQFALSLIAALRKRSHSDSTLTQEIADYALAMELQNATGAPQEKPFELAALLEAAQSGARRAEPPRRRVHLSVSLKPGAVRRFKGAPDLIEPLLRHLLLISLRRTRSGPVFLRLETEAMQGRRGKSILRIRLEDSGPATQRGQLRQWLRHVPMEEFLFSGERDLSWLLITSLLSRMGGGISGEPVEGGGMKLIAWLPLIEMDDVALPVVRPPEHAIEPLVLLVETDTRAPKIFAEAGYLSLTVDDHGQALNWAPALPVSAIVLNAAEPVLWQSTARRLREMMHSGILPEVPLWVLSVQNMHETEMACIAPEHLLLKPVQPSLLKTLRADLKSFDTDFYLAHDAALREDYPPAIVARLPEMEAALGLQVAGLWPLLRRLKEDKVEAWDAAAKAHAVKSAALTLGHFRLAALMNELEHAISERSFSHLPENWNVILTCLERSFPTQKPMDRVAVSS